MRRSSLTSGTAVADGRAVVRSSPGIGDEFLRGLGPARAKGRFSHNKLSKSDLDLEADAIRVAYAFASQ